jgi:nucleoside-diphosphate-sugar epimerase
MSGQAQRVLVVGGKFVGRTIATQLSHEGYEVGTLNRTGSGPDDIAHRFVGERSLKLPDLLESWRPASIVDMCVYVPHEATQTASAARAIDAHYIMLSTAAVYRADARPSAESDALQPDAGWGSYAALKAMAENAAMRVGGRISILRPVYFLGPSDPIRRCAYVFSRARCGLPLLLPGLGDAPLQTVHRDDIASAVVTLIERGPIGTLNVGCRETLSVREFYEQCAELSTTDACAPVMRSMRFGAELYEEGWWPFPNLPMVVDSGLLANEIGVECRSTSQSIREAFAWWNNLSTESQKPVRFAKEEQVLAYAESVQWRRSVRS